MWILIQPQLRPDLSPTDGEPRPSFWLLLLTIVLLTFALKHYLSDAAGRFPGLDPDRAAKLAKELDELEQAEQYVLLAARDGRYPCYPCPSSTTIQLREGQVWKYGVTRKGERGRYGRFLMNNGLMYVVQYQGPLQECLRQEKLKIYHYALHPENLARPIPLIRPPGNKQDN